MIGAMGAQEAKQKKSALGQRAIRIKKAVQGGLLSIMRLRLFKVVQKMDS